VFVRGARRVSPAVRDAALMDVSLTLNIRPEDMPFEASMPAGNAALNREFYGPITKAMAAGPRRVNELLNLPMLVGKRDNPAELIGILIGLDLAEPALRRESEPDPRAMRFNRVTTANLLRSEILGRPVAAASHTLGAGALCTVGDLYVLDRVQAGEGEANIEEWVGELGTNLNNEGRDMLRELLGKSLSIRLPILRAQGVF
jgi:hypothetical protein